jgi:hypothetical protein
MRGSVRIASAMRPLIGVQVDASVAVKRYTARCARTARTLSRSMSVPKPLATTSPRDKTT